jgi:hypothetical protein
MINSQTATGSTIELFGYRYELPTECEYEDMKKVSVLWFSGNKDYSKNSRPKFIP